MGSKTAARKAKAARALPVEVALSWRSPQWLVFAGLLVFGFLLYARTFSYGFVAYDDDKYVTANVVVQRGLTSEGIKWAFTTSHFANWLPITWLSHMLDVSLFGMGGGGHHVTNAMLHGVNAALLFAVLHNLTGSRWRSAAVALLFAAHPLRVESVAWISERKDVLAGTFFLLTILAYERYVRRPSPGRYAGVAVLFALGLMSKTMLVTLPCVLLLLDWWPLRRLRLGRSDATVDEEPGGRGSTRLNSPKSARAAARQEARPPEDARDSASDSPSRSAAWVFLEKLPLLLLAAIASIWTAILQARGGALELSENLSLGQRLANAAVAVPRYLGKTLWPDDLSPLYMHPRDWPVWVVAGSVALIVTITAAAWMLCRRMPYLLVGWLWFLGMLVPVSGIAAQAGLQSIADRYMYLPGIGLTIACIWLAADLLRRFRPGVLRPVGIALTATATIALGVVAVLQQRHWANTHALFSKALSVDETNWLAHSYVGAELAARNQRTAAIEHFRRAIALRPDFAEAHFNLGNSLGAEGRLAEAEAALREAIRLKDDNDRAWLSLGTTLARKGDLAAATAAYERALQLNPHDAEAHAMIAAALLDQEQIDAAMQRLRRALEIDPANARATRILAEAHVRRGAQLMRQNQIGPAVQEFERALSIDPKNANARRALGAIRAGIPNQP